jgi:hypothetical protein
MRGLQHGCLLASTICALMLGAQFGTFAQDSNEPPATFNERFFPADQTSTQPSRGIQEDKKEQNVTTTPHTARAKRASAVPRIVGGKRARSRVVVVPRSFLDAGAEVPRGERRFLDYAFPPTHVVLEVVTNTGGRVGWHNSPLPGPLFPSSN